MRDCVETCWQAGRLVQRRLVGLLTHSQRIARAKSTWCDFVAPSLCKPARRIACVPPVEQSIRLPYQFYRGQDPTSSTLCQDHS